MKLPKISSHQIICLLLCFSLTKAHVTERGLLCFCGPVPQVLEQRQVESQLLQEECVRVSEQGSSALVQPEPPPVCSTATPHSNLQYSLNLSFEELSTAGLEEPVRPPINHWMGVQRSDQFNNHMVSIH